MTKALTTMILLIGIGFHCNAQINIEEIDRIIQNAAKNDLFEGTVLIADSGNIASIKLRSNLLMMS